MEARTNILRVNWHHPIVSTNGRKDFPNDERLQQSPTSTINTRGTSAGTDADTKAKVVVNNDVRFIPEFEEMGAVIISYPIDKSTSRRAFGIPLELICALQQKKTVHVYVFAKISDTEKSDVKTAIEKAQTDQNPFDPNFLHFVDYDTDTYWTRDFGPWWIENKSNNKHFVVKHTYTTKGGGEFHSIFRPRDDYATYPLLDLLNQSAEQNYLLGLLHVGGNVMTNGEGIAASSTLVLEQNVIPFGGKVEEVLDRVNNNFASFLGISDYMLFKDPEPTYIGHIDCWGKFLSKDIVLLGVVPGTESDIAKIETEFRNKKFQVFKVDVPYLDERKETTAAYCNSLILNKHVYVPIVWDGVSSAQKEFGRTDKAALDEYKKALPSYTIVGVPGSQKKPWLGTDALHCRTKGIPKAVISSLPRFKKAENPKNQVLVLYGEDNPGGDVGIKADRSHLKDKISPLFPIDFLQMNKQTLQSIVDKCAAYKQKGVEKLFIYYTGHGANLPGSYFPAVETKGDTMLQLERVYDEARKLGFVLTIVGSDCCNTVYRGLITSSRDAFRGDLRNIFNGTGALLFSASTVGQSSQGEAKVGGLFTNKWLNEFGSNWQETLQSLHNAFHEQTACWIDADYHP